jgi:hypothetical protein
MGVFITEYCPIKCDHCAVSASSKNEKTLSSIIYNHADEMARLPSLHAVALTGGEPFAVFNELTQLVEIFHHRKKSIIIYTSGYWGNSSELKIIKELLPLIDGFVFGIDLYHRVRISDSTLVNSLRCCADAEAWIVAQVLCGVDREKHVSYALSILEMAFGANWGKYARICNTTPLESGRARSIKSFLNYPSSPEGFCYSINGPTLLDNGSVAACCNADVVRYKGPTTLRSRIDGHLYKKLKELERRPLVSFIRRLPPFIVLKLASAIVKDDSLSDVCSMCDACWQADRVLSSMSKEQIQLLKKMTKWLITKNKGNKWHLSSF